MLLDHNLTFLPHIKRMGEKAKALFGKIGRTLKLKYGVKSSRLNFLYRTVFVPVIGYGERVLEDRLNHSHIKKSIRGTQRKVLINITGAYCTTSLLALCTVTGNMPIDIKLRQDLQIWRVRQRRRRGEPVEDTVTAIKDRGRNEWQEEWSAAEVGRTTFGLLPDIAERLKLRHLNEIDHFSIQLLTGHGAFGNYLRKHNKMPHNRCTICEDEDSPSHPIMECPGTECERDIIEDKVRIVGLERPWNINTLLRNPETHKTLMAVWKVIYAKRKM